jgi:23S rRNA (guanosine2251-2'-O)-methyltransferase
VPHRRQALERIVLHATTLRIPIVEVQGGSLTAVAGFDGHQGIALVVEPRRFATLDDVLARAIERAEPAFVLVLDSLEDPQNVGTLLRSAEAAGVHGVVFPTERQAPLTPAAVKASAGATEHLLLCPVDDLAAALTDLHIRGVRIVGSDSEAPMSARQADLRGPIAIVVGSEGQGLGPAIRRRADLFVRIPMRGSIGSLNAAAAGSILLFEALGQRAPDARPASGEGTTLRAARGRGEPDRLEPAIDAADAVAPDVDSADAGADAAEAALVEATEEATTPAPKRTRAARAKVAPAPEAAPSLDPAAMTPGAVEERAKRARRKPSANAAAATEADPSPDADAILPGEPVRRRRSAPRA